MPGQFRSEGNDSEGKHQRQWDAIVFYVLLLAMCFWILALPLFPSQDGSAHKYYATMLGRLASGDAGIAQSFAFRHPIPPYASQAFLLVALARVFSMDMADQIFVCLVVLSTAIGIRWCCSELGPGGRWSSMFVFPLLLNWSLLMGFMNYSLGVGLLFVAFACWMRAVAGRGRYWPAFVVCTACITLTHPVPLLMLLVLCCFDLATQALNEVRQGRKLSLRAHLPQIGGVLVVVLAIVFPLLSADPTRTSTEATHTMFRFRAYITDLSLYGLSPYFRHSHAPLILLYKLLLYVILIAGFAMAARGFGARWRERTMSRADYLLIGAVLAYIGVPLLPGSVNGSQFATRLLPFAWFGILLAASRVTIAPAQRKLFAGAAGVAWVLTMLPAQRYIRPAAKQIEALESTPFPAHRHGLILAGNDGSRPKTELEFGPQIWGAMLPMMRNDDVLVNSPWLDLTSYPIAPGADPRLMINELQSRQEQQQIDLHDGDLSFLRPETRKRILAGTDFIFATGAEALASGQIPSLTIEESSAFRCATHQWFLLCEQRVPGE